MKTRLKKIIILLLLLVLGIFTGSYSQEVPKMVKPYVKLERSYIVEFYQNPVIQNGRYVSYGQFLRKEMGWSKAGSGTIISPDGLILTNNHVASTAVEVELKDKEKNIIAVWKPVSKEMLVDVLEDNDPLKPVVAKYVATPLGFDHLRDVAVLKITSELSSDGNTLHQINKNNFNYVRLGNPFDIPISSRLMVLGYPGIGGRTITISKGDFLGYTNNVELDGYPINNGMLKSDATIQHGNSGGAALYKGNIIGIPTLGSQDQGFALGYLDPVTWAAGPLTIAKILYGENFPVINKTYVKSDYNMDITKKEIYAGGRIYSAQSKQPLSKASVIIYRKDRTINQILALDKEIYDLETKLDIQKFYNAGYSVNQIAKYYKSTYEVIQKIVNTKLTLNNLSPDAKRCWKGEFFYRAAITDNAGFFITDLPPNQQFNIIAKKNGFRDLQNSIQTSEDVSEAIGSFSMYQY